MDTASDDVRAAAAVLHANGNETEDSITAIRQAVAALSRPGEPDFDWDAVTPTGINMARVEATLRAVDDLREHRSTPEDFRDRVHRAATLPPSGPVRFTLACVVGAAALAIIFGVRHWPALAAICVAAGLGAVVRRGLGRWGAGAVTQAFAAALLAGIAGAIAVRLHASSELRLVVVCPCMVLVPGPHLLNGVLDLAATRLRLGAARLLWAGLILLGISAGLLLGLALGGEALPPTVPGREIPWWLDILAAAVVVPCYLTFYSARLSIALWPAVIGGLAHGVRWYALTELHLNLAIGTGLACLVAATALLPLARRHGVPFAAAGFAAIVSLVPGVYIFRAASALTQLAWFPGDGTALLVSAAQDAMIAALVLLAMLAGLLLPITAWRRVTGRSS